MPGTVSRDPLAAVTGHPLASATCWAISSRRSRFCGRLDRRSQWSMAARQGRDFRSH